jgi:hypothetical protein
MYFSKKDKLKTSLLEAKVDDEYADAAIQYEGGSDNNKLAYLDFCKFDANFSRLNQLQEIAPRECKTPSADPKQPTVDEMCEALKKFETDYKAGSKELGKVLDYQESDFKHDLEKKNLLTANSILHDLEGGS